MFWIIAVLLALLSPPKASGSDVMALKETGSIETIFGPGKRYAYWKLDGKPLKWKKMPIAFWISSRFPSGKIGDVRFCFQDISNQTGGAIWFEYNGIKKARFTSEDGVSVVDAMEMSNASGINQCYSANGYISESDIAINPSTFTYPDQEALRGVLFHELVHGLGLQHVPDPKSLMAETLTELNPQKRIDDGTLEGLQFLYGSSQNSNQFLASDFNRDGRVDFIDFSIFADSFGTRNSPCDLDRSGLVDFTDFFLFVGQFGK